MAQTKRVYELRIFEGRVMLPEEQEQIYMQLLTSKRMEFATDSMREAQPARRIASAPRGRRRDFRGRGSSWHPVRGLTHQPPR